MTINAKGGKIYFNICKKGKTLNRQTIYNWKTNRVTPNLKTLKKAKDAGHEISEFKKLAIKWHLKQVEEINKL